MLGSKLVENNKRSKHKRNIFIILQLLFIFIYIYIYKLVNRGWGRREGSLFNSYNTEV